MKHDGDQRGKMAEKEVLLPEGRPWEIEEQGSHFEANNDQQRAKDTVHGTRESPASMMPGISGWASEEQRYGPRRHGSQYSSHRPERNSLALLPAHLRIP